LQHKLDHLTAVQILKARCGTDGRPLFKYDAQQQASREWFELELEKPIELAEEELEWQRVVQ